ncbi:MAG TPA: IS1595 family transposase [Geminicoccus sp.]|uniref:IS1595 family transposase n=1 Tax=Geminicoccus sp. TaxID=2024832 RepID=UPI002E3590EF|nr:IS1595 family transposase [Geminicoccus sp.]HEX2526588.1 IS1595 family transposase [Geminicoccus sp.]
MAQHFLLSAAARTLSLVRVARMTDEEAYDVFRKLRWQDTKGEAVCPRCECVACYEFKTRRIFKCKACLHQFTVTSSTIFASRKLPIRTYLLAIAISVNAVKGLSALQLGRDLDVQYKTAFVMAHKIRESMSADQDRYRPQGEVEIDGCYVGGHIRQANRKADRKDRRLAQHQTGKRRVVVVMRERNGRTLPFVVRSEEEAVSTIARRVQAGSTVHADEAASWDALHARFAMKRINHLVAFSDEGSCTNQAESFFSRLRRAEYGQHHHISGPYLRFYAGEAAWKEDMRRESNGVQLERATVGALSHGKSRNWCGYWQRSA